MLTGTKASTHVHIFCKFSFIPKDILKIVTDADGKKVKGTSRHGSVKYWLNHHSLKNNIVGLLEKLFPSPFLNSA